MREIDPIDRIALMEKLGIGKECTVCEQNSEPYCKWKPDVVDVCEAICTAPTIEPRCEACEAFNKTRLLIPQPQQQKGKLMRRRTFEEMITYFNQTVSDMDIDRKHKITLLGIVTALLQKHDEDVAQIEPQRKRGKWIYGESEAGNDGYYCSKCGNFVPWKYDEYDIDFIKEFLFCNKCGADMTEGEG